MLAHKGYKGSEKGTQPGTALPGSASQCLGLTAIRGLSLFPCMAGSSMSSQQQGRDKSCKFLSHVMSGVCCSA
jgi:hypothetical protein